MAGDHSEQFAQLQWVEAQLARPDVQLTPAEQELVKNHRLAHLELLQQQVHGLGPVPASPGELAIWERRKAEATSEVNLVAESWRLQMLGLSEAWEKFRRVEDLQRLRGVYSIGLADGQQAASGHLQQGGECTCPPERAPGVIVLCSVWVQFWAAYLERQSVGRSTLEWQEGSAGIVQREGELSLCFATSVLATRLLRSARLMLVCMAGNTG